MRGQGRPVVAFRQAMHRDELTVRSGDDRAARITVFWASLARLAARVSKFFWRRESPRAAEKVFRWPPANGDGDVTDMYHTRDSSPELHAQECLDTCAADGCWRQR